MTASARTATLDDVPALVALMQEFYAEADFDLEHEVAGDSFLALLRQPQLGQVWLLQDNGAAAGFLVLTVRFAMEFGGLDGFIDDLFVRATSRRRGLASAGLKALLLESHRRGLLALHVEVGEDNAAAQTLYRAFGLAPGTDRRQFLTVAPLPFLVPPTT
jgi:ribosomal protein S18 acetylase RimI-like enzyme